MRATDATYDEIPYEDLSIEAIDWSERGQYIRTRSTRKNPREFDVEPEWATETAMDPLRKVGPGRSVSGETIRVVGRSAGAGRFLTVLLIGKDIPVRGDWLGINAWAASKRDLRDMSEVNQDD